MVAYTPPQLINQFLIEPKIWKIIPIPIRIALALLQIRKRVKTLLFKELYMIIHWLSITHLPRVSLIYFMLVFDSIQCSSTFWLGSHNMQTFTYIHKAEGNISISVVVKYIDYYIEQYI